MHPKPPSADRSRREGNQTGSRASLLTAGVEGSSAEKNYTVKEVAEVLSISAQAVYQLCAKKKLRHLRLGIGRGTLRIPASALDEFVTQSTIQPVRVSQVQLRETESEGKASPPPRSSAEKPTTAGFTMLDGERLREAWKDRR